MEQHEYICKSVVDGTLLTCAECSRQILYDPNTGKFKVVNTGEDPRIPHTGFSFIYDDKPMKVEPKSDSNQKTI